MSEYTARFIAANKARVRFGNAIERYREAIRRVWIGYGRPTATDGGCAMAATFGQFVAEVDLLSLAMNWEIEHPEPRPARELAIDNRRYRL